MSDAKPRYIELDGVLYERVPVLERPSAMHFLPSWRSVVVGEGERYKTVCGKTLLDSGYTRRTAHSGTSVRSDVTCHRCCQILGIEPVRHKRVQFVISEEGVDG